MTSLPLGSLATNLSSDRQTLLIALATLAGLNEPLASKHRAKRIVKKAETDDELSMLDRYQLKREVAVLIRDLNRFAPTFTYIGYQPSDPSHLGVWVDLYALHEAERKGRLTQIVGSSAREWRGIKSAYVLCVDEGLTLYRRRDKTVIWSA